MTINVDVTVHVHMADVGDLQRIETKVGRVILLLREVLEATVKDPAQVERLITKVDAAAAGLKEAVKSAT